MSNWKLVVGVMLGSLLLVGLVAVVMSRMIKNGGVGVEASVAELVKDAGWAVGDENAKVVVVEFADLQCPACKKAEPIAKKLMSTAGVRYVYRHLPLETIHKNAVSAARLVEASRMQGQGWEMKDLLFEKQEEWSGARNFEKLVAEYGEEVGMKLDLDKLKSDYKSGEARRQIDVDLALARRLKLNGTPTFFVNGKLTATAFVLTEVEKLLNDE